MAASPPGPAISIFSSWFETSISPSHLLPAPPAFSPVRSCADGKGFASRYPSAWSPLQATIQQSRVRAASFWKQWFLVSKKISNAVLLHISLPNLPSIWSRVPWEEISHWMYLYFKFCAKYIKMTTSIRKTAHKIYSDFQHCLCKNSKRRYNVR